MIFAFSVSAAFSQSKPLKSNNLAFSDSNEFSQSNPPVSEKKANQRPLKNGMQRQKPIRLKKPILKLCRAMRHARNCRRKYRTRIFSRKCAANRFAHF